MRNPGEELDDRISRTMEELLNVYSEEDLAGILAEYLETGNPPDLTAYRAYKQSEYEIERGLSGQADER